ncbi:hypothetical protein [Paenibacillus tarimensis]|uniref:hypothetical protein n=1 Tax=Paenibacillus tarimensis TaxID=416012 RepID=UPI001F225B6A|nr:hypothetical protein [Paenibacillus tarimensis]MCF2945693.1 hypothetical protein [Paenibacillus tarimensis]
MHMIACHPIIEDAIQPHCGRTVMAMTHSGDLFTGVMDRIQDGVVYFKPAAGIPQAAVQQFQKQAAAHPAVKRLRKRRNRKALTSGNKTKKAGTQAFGLGYPGYGYGYPGYGYPGYGLGLAIPLFILAALFAAPFF